MKPKTSFRLLPTSFTSIKTLSCLYIFVLLLSFFMYWGMVKAEEIGTSPCGKKCSESNAYFEPVKKGSPAYWHDYCTALPEKCI